MALTSPNTLGGRDRIEDALAYLVDAQTDFDAIGATTALGKQYLDALELALDSVAREAGCKYLERTDGALNVKAPYATGTVTATQDSTAITGSGTTWSTGTLVNVGTSHFKLDREESGILVSAVGGNTALTLAQAMIGVTASALTYEIVNDDYDLAAGVWQLLAITALNPSRRPLTVLTYGEWLARTGGQWQTGEPEYAVVLGHNAAATGATGTAYRIRLWPAPDVRYQYEYHYRTVPTFPATGATFETSPAAQHLLIWKAASYLFGDRGEFARAQEYRERYAGELRQFLRIEQSRTVVRGPRLRSLWEPTMERWPTNLPAADDDA